MRIVYFYSITDIQGIYWMQAFVDFLAWPPVFIMYWSFVSTATPTNYNPFILLCFSYLDNLYLFTHPDIIPNP